MRIKKIAANIGILLACGLVLAAIFYFDDASPTSPLSGGDYPEATELSMKQMGFQEYSDYFRKLSEDKGAPYAFQILRRAQFPGSIDLHLLAHTVGDMLYEQQGIDGIKVCTDDFRNACSHSIVIGVLRDRGVSALPDIAATCKQAPGGRGAYTMCFHGLGHGVLAFNDYNFEKAVEMCKLTGTPEYRNREYIECVGGAMMEMIAGVHDRDAWQKQVGNYFKDSDPLYPCDADFVSAEAKEMCYTYLTPHLFKAAGIDLGQVDPSRFATAFSYCSLLAEGSADRRACYGGFGKEFPVIAAGRDIRDIGHLPPDKLALMQDWCESAGNADGRKDCNLTALASLFWGGENAMDAAFAYCKIATGETQAYCYDALLGNVFYYLGPSGKTDSACSLFPEPYTSRCLAGPTPSK